MIRTLIGALAVSLLVMATLGAGFPSTGSPPRGFAPPLNYGDVNGDGLVNVVDASLTLRIALGLITPDPGQFQRADVFPYPPTDPSRTIGDGVVDVRDVQRMLAFAVGLIPESDFRPQAGGGSVSFSNDVQPILQNTCESFLCHGGRIPKGGMSLTAGGEYDVIVNVESTEAPGVLRVKPGDPDHSYLLAKLLGTQDSLGGSGDRMPAGEALIPPPLPQDQIRTIHDWIAEGAPNN